MATPNGVHHLALMTADVKGQIEFFSDVLGMKLKALYWMHNVDGYFHAFMELNANSSVAFVFSPTVKDIPTEFGVSHAGNPVKPCAAGNMQHVAFSVDTVDELLAMRDRIRSRGVRVLGPLDHGFCQSIYFGGPENLVLEVSTSAAAIDAEAWIDPEVVALNDISARGTRALQEPGVVREHRRRAGGAAARPATACRSTRRWTPPLPAAFDLPDEVVTREMSENTPPVKVASAG